MGDKGLKGILDPSDSGKNIQGLIDPGGTIIKRATGSDIGLRAADPLGLVPKDPGPALAAAAKAEAETQEKIAKQEQKERARLAIAAGDVASRKFAASTGRSGRSLLIATSPTGTRSRNLGGTA